MIANIAILLFVALMAYLWSIQGAFSAFLHCVYAIIAGAIAFAVWETVAVKWLLGMIPTFAWTVGLLVPFVVSLLLMRLASDQLIKGKLDFSQLVDTAVGGCIGLIAGLLTAGITIIALGFMPLGNDLGGYEPFKNYDSQGQLVGKAGDGLWVPVDKYVTGFYNMLSNGALSSTTPMAIYQPDIARQAASHRLGRGSQSSAVVEPDIIKLNKMYIPDRPLSEFSDAVPQEIRNVLTDANRKVVIIDSTWKRAQKSGAYVQGALNVSTTQIQLVTTDDKSKHGHLFNPIAAAQTGKNKSDGRIFLPFAIDPGKYINSEGRPTTSFASIFVIPRDQTPQFILYRHLRFELPDEKKATTDVNEISQIAGLTSVVKTPQQIAQEEAARKARASQSQVGDRSGVKTGTEAVAIEISNLLPETISKGAIYNLKFNGNLQLTSGSDDIKRTTGISPKNRINEIFISPYTNSVRVELAQDKVHSLLGGARAAAARTQRIYLDTDDPDDKPTPIAYVLHRKGDKSQLIKIDPNFSIQTGTNLPTGEMKSGDKLYIYFHVNVDRLVTAYHLGQATQEINPPLPVPKVEQ